jgi:hypothetical protein
MLELAAFDLGSVVSDGEDHRPGPSDRNHARLAQQRAAMCNDRVVDNCGPATERWDPKELICPLIITVSLVGSRTADIRQSGGQSDRVTSFKAPATKGAGNRFGDIVSRVDVVEGAAAVPGCKPLQRPI